MSRPLRVAGVDPGTVSVDVCVLEDGEPVLERSVPTAEATADPPALAAAISERGPVALVYGPAGYGLPLVRGEDLTEAHLAEIVLVRAEEAGGDVGIGGMRGLVRAFAAAGPPLVLGPGVVHLPTVPAHRKWNRIDLGTADKVCAVAAAVHEQARRLRSDDGAGRRTGQDGSQASEVAPPRGGADQPKAVSAGAVAATSFILLELGGAFSAGLAVEGGAIVDGVGGSSGPIGVRGGGAVDGEVAALLGDAFGKATVFGGGALDPDGTRGLRTPEALAASRADPADDPGWAALEEGAVKAVLALTASVPAPREVLLSGRTAQAPGLAEALAGRLAHVAPVRLLPPTGAARGAALLADGLADGAAAPIVDALALRDAAGTALDHLRVPGARRIRLG